MPETRRPAEAESEQIKQRMLAANNQFAQGDATQLKELCSHRGDVTLFGGVSGDESRIKKLIATGFKRILFLIEPGTPDVQWPVLERYAGLIRSFK